MRGSGSIWLIAAVSILPACREKPECVTIRQSREVMGTLAEVTAVAADGQTAQAAVEAAFARLQDVDRLMSDYRDDSEIGRLNALGRGEGMVVSPETFCVLQHAQEVSRMSAGAFDVTCRPLVKLWKQAGKDGQLPAKTALERALASVGWSKLELDPITRTATKTVAGMQVDVGGIAKGYALDLAAVAMRKAGASSGLIDVGGDVLAVGRQADGSPWRIGVQHPFRTGLILKLALADRAVATSGNQQRFAIIDGKRYSHIMDPRTGWPAEQAPCVTVVAPDGITADAWATALSVLTVQEGQERAERVAHVEVMWIWGTGEKPHVSKTSGFDAYVTQ